MRPAFLSWINVLLLLLAPFTMGAQMITGVWKGRINRQKAEVKLILDGDSLRGTSYYYESPDHYRRYSIRGYFNAQTNEAVWWDDQLLEEKTGKFSLATPGRNALLSSADFNCPGDGTMMLDGKAGKKENGPLRGEVHLEKIPGPQFEDEWDFVIENYTIGANDPDIIDSIGRLVNGPERSREPVPVIPEERTVAITPVPALEKQAPETQPAPEKAPPVAVQQPTIEEKFSQRKKVLASEIPVSGDSIELRFYDNAEIDGDSISLFLNDQLIFRHIRLTGQAYTIKLPVGSLNETNELIMVAENLGTIPPNTSYMVALVGEKRYEARLESTEGSSAMIRFVKKEEVRNMK